MPSVSATYGGKFMDVPGVKAVANGAPLEFTIKAVGVADFKGKLKFQLSFRECDRLLTLNKTSAKAIGAAYGDASEGWVGRAVKITTGLVAFGTGQVEAVLAEPVNGQRQPTPLAPSRNGKGGVTTERDPAPQTVTVEDAITECGQELRGGVDVWRVKGRAYEYFTKDAGVGRAANDLAGMGEVVKLTYRMAKSTKDGSTYRVLTAIVPLDPEPVGVGAGADLSIPEDDIPF